MPVEWQVKPEACASFLPVESLNRTAVRRDYGLADGQPQADSFPRIPVHRPEGHKLIKNPVLNYLFDPRTVILYGKPDPFRGRLRFYPDKACLLYTSRCV